MKKLFTHSPVAMVKQGFTLIEALIVIVLIGILSGLLVSAFNPNNSKGAILFNNAVQIRDALKRANLDFSGYPAPGVAGSLQVLFNNTPAIQVATNYSSGSLPRNWRGPYIDPLPTNAAGNPIFADISENATVTIPVLVAMPATGPYASRTPFILSINAVPFGIAMEAVRSCLNVGTQGAGAVTDVGLITHNQDFALGSCRLNGGGVAGNTAFQVLIGV